MKPRPFDARRLDVEAFARAGEALDGSVPLDHLPRLAGERFGHDGPSPLVRWRAEGQWQRVPGTAERAALHLQARVALPLQCQRCLAPVQADLKVDRSFAFARDEDEAARLDEASDEDMLVLSRSFDLLELLEDELILALPLVPRHEECPAPLQPTQDIAGGDIERASPFAVLGVLRRG